MTSDLETVTSSRRLVTGLFLALSTILLRLLDPFLTHRPLLFYHTLPPTKQCTLFPGILTKQTVLLYETLFAFDCASCLHLVCPGMQWL